MFIARKKQGLSALALGALVASLGACSAAQEPPKVVTVSTEPPGAQASASPSVEPVAPVAPAPTTLPQTEKEEPSQGTAKPVSDQLSQLDAAMLQALSNAGSGTATGTLSLGSGLSMGGGGGGGLAGLSAGTSSGAAGAGGGKVTGPGGPVVNAAVGPVTVSGGAIANAAAVSAGMAAGFRRCGNRAVQDSPGSLKTGSSVAIVAKVDVSGAVLSTTAQGVVSMPPAALSCVLARVKSAMFAQPDTGSVTVRIPVVFTVQ